MCFAHSRAEARLCQQPFSTCAQCAYCIGNEVSYTIKRDCCSSNKLNEACLSRSSFYSSSTSFLDFVFEENPSLSGDFHINKAPSPAMI